MEIGSLADRQQVANRLAAHWASFGRFGNIFAAFRAEADMAAWHYQRVFSLGVANHALTVPFLFEFELWASILLDVKY